MEHFWETIIGLEIHAELNTKSKLFAPSLNHFGNEPNSNISAVCTGMPGSLPVINEEAVRKAVQLGCALKATINTTSTFDRKSYFYPDSPRNFQITQFEHPIIRGGSVTAIVSDKEMVFKVNRAHLEDDAGMLKHFSSFAGVDYNRAGVPLIEIVSEPCMHSAKEASAYAYAVKAILDAIDASDCNMEEGSLRIDVNVSVRKKGEPGFRNKIEIKNMNSFSNLEKAIDYEIKRQIEVYEKNPDKDPLDVIGQATYRFDPDKGETILMRRKEDADDYRYFPEPDLPPLVITEEFIESERKKLPELPLDKEKRYIGTLGLSKSQAFALAYDKKLAKYFEKALEFTKNAKALANWLCTEFPGRLKDKGLSLVDTLIMPQHVAELINLIDTNAITGKIAKSIADDLVSFPGKTPQSFIDENPHYRPISALDAISPIVDRIVESNPQSVKDFLAGRERALAYLIGQVMKETKGAASPAIVNELILKKIEKFT